MLITDPQKEEMNLTQLRLNKSLHCWRRKTSRTFCHLMRFQHPWHRMENDEHQRKNQDKPKYPWPCNGKWPIATINGLPYQKKNPKILDLILTTHLTFKTRCKPVSSRGNCDHDVFLYEMSLMPFRVKPPWRKLYLWKRANMNTLGKTCVNMQTVDADPTLFNSIDRLWSNFTEALLRIIEKRVPSKTTPARHSNPWINTDICRAT